MDSTETVLTSSHNDSSDVDQWQLMILRYGLRTLSPAGYTGCAVYLFLMGLIATIGNSTTLIMFSCNRKLRVKPHNMLLINLAVSDLGISIFGYPLTTSSCFARRWLWGEVGCTVQGFTTFVFALVDMYTLAVVSVYRWVAVCKPQHNHRLRYSVTLKLIAVLWVICCVICGLPLVGISSYTYEPFGTSCTIDWDLGDPANVFYVYMLIVIAYILPVAVMGYCYTKVVFRSGELLRALKQARTATLNLREAEEANTTIAESKVTWISLMMVAVFVLIWSPYAFISALAIHSVELPVWMTTLPTMCCKASCMLNPLIFYVTSPVFRATFKSTFINRNKVTPQPQSMAGAQTFKVDKTKEGVFIGETSVTFRKAETTLF